MGVSLCTYTHRYNKHTQTYKHTDRQTHMHTSIHTQVHMHKHTHAQSPVLTTASNMALYPTCFTWLWWSLSVCNSHLQTFPF